MAAEAILHEELRLSCGGALGRGRDLGAEMLLAASSAAVPAQLTGLQALGQKLHYCGVASGLEVGPVLTGLSACDSRQAGKQADR